MEKEIFKAKKREAPTGRGRELNEAMGEHLLLFEKIESKVIFVNPELNLPFKFEELGLFAKDVFLGWSEQYRPLQKGEHRLENWPAHRRSALLGRLIFGDKDGRLYRDLDLKGIGFVEEGMIWESGRPLPGIEEEYYGFFEKRTALKEHRLREEFIKAGIRTARTLAIIELEKIISRGEEISVKEAINDRGLMKKGFKPVVEVRAFGTKGRISDIIVRTENWEKEIKGLILDDAKKLVSQETGKDLSGNREYLQWFAQTLGQNLGLMHKNGWVHRQLRMHNITLDCRIVDLDDAAKIDKLNNQERSEEIGKDINDALKSFQELVRVFDERQFLELKKLFFKRYNKAFPGKKRLKFLEKIR